MISDSFKNAFQLMLNLSVDKDAAGDTVKEPQFQRSQLDQLHYSPSHSATQQTLTKTPRTLSGKAASLPEMMLLNAAKLQDAFTLMEKNLFLRMTSAHQWT
jgi:hypothetical protein